MRPIWRVSLTFIAYYAATGAAWPYLPIYYRTFGLNFETIGGLAALGAAVQLIGAPVWGVLADAYPRSRLTLPAAAVLAALGATVLAGAHDLVILIVGNVILAGGLAGVASVLDARAIETLGADRIRYGQIRSLGSVSFIVVAWLVGVLIDRSGVAALFFVYVGALVVTALISTTLVRNPATRFVSIARGALAFAVAPGMRLFLSGAFLVAGSLTAANAFYSLRLSALGAPAQIVGLAWALGSCVEVPLMWSYPRIARRWGTGRPVVLGAALFAVRASVAAVATDPVTLLASSLIEGVAFSLFYVGGVTFIGERAPSGMAATAQGVFSAVGGLAAIAGSILGGAIAGAVSLQGLFAVCACTGAIAAAVIAVAIRATAMPAAGAMTARVQSGDPGQ